ncbi:tyrosine-type recombinase/integrase [Neisseria elongata]|uniref:tyrosine-type recombinase/integrase n=1 Tax=Neisseria elongata TaxID=495 RepID=UPI0028EE81BB|nr:tyrosine-type recombinase/integrase [Neisseria elongata]
MSWWEFRGFGGDFAKVSGNTPFLFPSRIKTDGFISDATISRIIERMGYKGRETPHGFRSPASSVLNEQGFNPDAIERQLAHIENNKIRTAYNRADYLTERKEFMQWYGNFCGNDTVKPRNRYKARNPNSIFPAIKGRLKQ